MEKFNVMKHLVLLFGTFFLLGTTAQVEKFDHKIYNPGDLNFYLQTPQTTDRIKLYPLIIALHGCNQSAENFAVNSGLAELAETEKVFLGLPEQKFINNGTRCFNWFRSMDNSGEKGELASIRAFIDSLIANYPVDPQRIYITGVSAGAAMSVALLVNYPDLFAGGSPMAGGCYCASNFRDGFRLMRHDDSLTDDFLKERIPFPKKKLPQIIIVQGEEDNVVDPLSANDIERQWLFSCSDSSNVSLDSLVNGIKIKRIFCGENEMVQQVSIPDFGHAIAISKNCGHTAPFIKDIDFCIMRYLFEEWDLITSHR